MATITVFMPVYNALPYLREAVESIRQQSLTDWVLLAVDDGSTDGSADYLQGLDDPRIRLICQPHQGPAVASNRALELCETEYIARMDADDVSLPTRLEEQFAFLCQHPEIGLVGTQFQYLGSEKVGRPSSLPTDHATMYADLLRGRHALCNGTIMCRTALLRAAGGYRAEGVLEDWSMFLRMGRETRVANLDRVLFRYRIHSGSTSERQTTEMRRRLAYVCDCARREIEGLAPLDYDEYLAACRHSFWRWTDQVLEGYAMTQYRRALGGILGTHPLMGRLRLAWAALCSPPLTAQRVLRGVRKWVGRQSMRAEPLFRLGGAGGVPFHTSRQP